MNNQVFSTYQVAKLCNVHHTTVINWVNEGALKAYTTVGGHRRIEKINLVKFMKEHNMPIPESMEKRRKLVLIVDDDVETVEEYSDALAGLGFDLDYALDGFEAGMKVYRGKPDAIILDFKMPGMDGFQVCEILSRDDETKDTPIIAVTVLSSEKEIKRIKNCGVKDYLPKPVDMDRLVAILKKLLAVS
ncbi:MAG: response regulator [Candidatus Omnitrophica bacterium]|nr:response regulator [Candidatus Omnitrophota bacterium]